MRRSPSGAIALFGWLLERRHGWWAPLLVFLVCGAGGAYVAVEVAGEGIALGANGAALGMLAAWTMRDVLGRRKGYEDDSDLLGVLAIAAVLVLLPLATTDASGVAGVVGGVIGILLGLIFARLPRALEASSRRRSTLSPALVARRGAGRQRARQRGHGQHDRDDQRQRERPGRADDVGALARAHRRISARKSTIPTGMPTTIAITPERRAARVDDAEHAARRQPDRP